MSENNILRLIEKFEESLENTEKLANTMMGLEGALKTLDSSLYQVYEITKVEGITNKSSELLEVLDNVKKVQGEINNEYDELINLKLYKDEIKKEIKEIKEYVEKLEDNIAYKVNDSILKVKEDILQNQMKIENKQNEMKDEILFAIREMIDSSNK